MGGGKESERTSKGKVRKKREDCSEMMRVQRGKARGAEHTVAGSVREEVRGSKQTREYFLCFPLCDNKSLQSIVSSIIQCQNIYLPIKDEDRIEGKFAVGVIFRHVLIAWIYLQLAFALLISREEWERNSIIQTWLCHKQSLKADNNTGCLLRLYRLDSKCELSL